MATKLADTQEEDVIVESGPPAAEHDDPDAEAVAARAGEEVASERPRDKRDSKKDSAAQQEREPGKSLLPFTRVQKIMKADKDLPIVARDATVLISLATEEFIKRLSQACQKLAEREKRTTVQQKDVASIVRRVDEFLFLEEIIGSQESTGRRKPQKAKADAVSLGDQSQSQATLRDFMQKPKDDEGTEESSNIVMDEDGAMHAG